MAEDAESKNLSPLQQRLIALMLEGLDDSATWRGLGFDEQELAEEVGQIRRLLDVPEQVELSDHLIISFPDPMADAVDGAKPADQERRLRLLLRLTITELMEVADSAEIRASMLTQTIEELGSDDVESAMQEARELAKVSQEIKSMVKKVLADIRGDA